MASYPVASTRTNAEGATAVNLAPWNTGLPGLAEILKGNPAWLDEAVDTAEASRITGLAVATLNTLRSRGGGPIFIKVGQRAVRYQRRQLLQFLSERCRCNTSDIRI
jgi:hypothetical protein